MSSCSSWSLRGSLAQESTESVGEIGQGVGQELADGRFRLVEAPPDHPGALREQRRQMLRLVDPLPGERTLATAPNGLDDEGRVARGGPVVEESQLGGAAHEATAARVGMGVVGSGWCGQALLGRRLSRGCGDGELPFLDETDQGAQDLGAQATSGAEGSHRVMRSQLVFYGRQLLGAGRVVLHVVLVQLLLGEEGQDRQSELLGVAQLLDGHLPIALRKEAHIDRRLVEHFARGLEGRVGAGDVFALHADGHEAGMPDGVKRRSAVGFELRVDAADEYPIRATHDPSHHGARSSAPCTAVLLAIPLRDA